MTFFLFGVGTEEAKLFSELGGFEDDELEIGLLWVSIGGDLRVKLKCFLLVKRVRFHWTSL